MQYARKIENVRFGQERALYGSRDLYLSRCRFEGEEDGESAVKECENIRADGCYMDLRYPFWHVRGLEINGCEMTVNCRAALWYDENVRIADSVLNGIKAFRECKNVIMENVTAVSPEFGWKCENFSVGHCKIVSQYAFFESSGIEAEDLDFEGKYSFQYVRNAAFRNSTFRTKDAFWHSKNVTVADSVIEGEYLGWYSEGLTLIRCRIKGTQPLCYCKNLKLIDCTTEDCDLAFEYSDVEADIKGGILSVKNPVSGTITADGIGNIVITDDSVYPVKAVIKTR